MQVVGWQLERWSAIYRAFCFLYTWSGASPIAWWLHLCWHIGSSPFPFITGSSVLQDILKRSTRYMTWSLDSSSLQNWVLQTIRWQKMVEKGKAPYTNRIPTVYRPYTDRIPAVYRPYTKESIENINVYQKKYHRIPNRIPKDKGDRIAIVYRLLTNAKNCSINPIWFEVADEDCDSQVLCLERKRLASAKYRTAASVVWLFGMFIFGERHTR